MRQQSYTQPAMSAPARSAAAGSPSRVLLVHANPFQRVTPVPAYGLERIRTAAEEAGAEVEILDPFLVSEDPLGTAREAAERFRPDLIGLGIRIIDDCIVVDRLEGEEPIDVSFLLPEIRELRDALGEAAPEATFVAGGAGFSACPQECLEYLDVEYGVVGAGEAAIAALVSDVPRGQTPGLVRKGEADGIGAYHLGFAGPTRREPLYAPANSFPVRTRIGCAMQCVYCTAANLGRQHANGGLDVVLEELERTVAGARERGVGRVPIFFADDEFNLPDERHPISVLEGLRERGLERHITWRAYFNPTPFSAGVRRPRARDERPRLDHRRQRRRPAARDRPEAVPAQASRRARRAARREERLGRPRADLRSAGRDRGDDRRDDRLRALAARVDRGRLLGRSTRVSAHTVGGDRPEGAGARSSAPTTRASSPRSSTRARGRPANWPAT